MNAEDAMKAVLAICDAAERAIRDKIVLLQILRQLGVDDPNGLLELNRERGDVQAELDDYMRPLHALKLAGLRALQDGTVDDSARSRPKKPN